MKKILFLIAVCLLVATASTACWGRDNANVREKVAEKMVYSNDAFSIELPKGWKYDASKWGGPDSINNEVDFYSEDSNVWFHFVKSFLPTSFLGITTVAEAAQMSIALKEHGRGDGDMDSLGDNGYIGVSTEGGSMDIDGYPAQFIGFEYKEKNDTVMNAQYVVLIPQEHRIFYLNANFYMSDARAGCVDTEFMENFIRSIKFKYSREGERNVDVEEFLKKFKDRIPKASRKD